MLNVVAIMGRLARDPELRQTTTGKNVVSFTLAVDRGKKDANGQNQTDWLNVVAWEKTAEFVCRYFSKGNLIAVTGRLQSRSYQDKNGVNRTAVEVLASQVSFCGEKKQENRQEERRENAPSYSQGNDADFALIEDDGDLPF